ncbi:MAG: hypothetical protein WCO09_02225 [bacterium]
MISDEEEAIQQEIDKMKGSSRQDGMWECFYSGIKSLLVCFWRAELEFAAKRKVQDLSNRLEEE